MTNHRKGRLIVPGNCEELKREILDEAHMSRLTIHPGSSKMYQDVKRTYRWNNMKREIATFVSKCLTCQKVKIEHQRPAGELQPLEIPEWKWENVTMDFLMGLPNIRKSHNAVWVIVDRLTKSAHFLPMKESDTVDSLARLYI